MELILIAEDDFYCIYALSIENKCYFTQYFENLPTKDQKQITNQIEFIAKKGTHNEQKMRLLENGIFEIKTRNSKRIYSFLDDNNLLLLTHGTNKRKPIQLGNEIEKAKRIRNQYFTDKGNGLNRIVEDEP